MNCYDAVLTGANLKLVNPAFFNCSEVLPIFVLRSALIYLLTFSDKEDKDSL